MTEAIVCCMLIAVLVFVTLYFTTPDTKSDVNASNTDSSSSSMSNSKEGQGFFEGDSIGAWFDQWGWIFVILFSVLCYCTIIPFFATCTCLRHNDNGRRIVEAQASSGRDVEEGTGTGDSQGDNVIPIVCVERVSGDFETWQRELRRINSGGTTTMGAVEVRADDTEATEHKSAENEEGCDQEQDREEGITTHSASTAISRARAKLRERHNHNTFTTIGGSAEDGEAEYQEGEYDPSPPIATAVSIRGRGGGGVTVATTSAPTEATATATIVHVMGIMEVATGEDAEIGQ